MLLKSQPVPHLYQYITEIFLDGLCNIISVFIRYSHRNINIFFITCGRFQECVYKDGEYVKTSLKLYHKSAFFFFFFFF